MNLKPYPSYKDSGVEWIGEIPEGWEVHKLKFISNIVLGKMLKNEDDGGNFLKPYLRAQNILWEQVDSTDINEMWFSLGEIISFKLQKNDLLVSEGGEVGRTAIWNDELDECYIQNSVHKVTINSSLISRYYLYLFEAYGKNGLFNSIVNRVSIAHLTREKLKEIRCISPPPPDQSAIASFLDRKTARIDNEIGLVERKIWLIEEYRKSLIHHVVTGKVDVRGVEA
ncbi:MAG: restriction endonuclease subunit S [Euryarchaeota archaeon]|nr:restriction endonuclease subunit S [Euryarchaeota archaeon]